jgi:hypothetical protein
MAIINMMFALSALVCFIRFALRRHNIFNIPDVGPSLTDWAGILGNAFMVYWFVSNVVEDLHANNPLLVHSSFRYKFGFGTALVLSIPTFYYLIRKIKRHVAYFGSSNPKASTYASFVKINNESVYDVVMNVVMWSCLLVSSITYFTMLYKQTA